jgi:hypothetical protein
MNRLKALFYIFLPIFLFSCGLEESYYLPQVPEANISRTTNTSATIIIPPIDSVQFYYASNYSIFYRIYISGVDEPSQIQTSNSNLNNINPSLAADFGLIEPYADPTNTSASTSVDSLFKSRNYFELELEGTRIKENALAKSGGTITILFPTVTGSRPDLSFSGSNFNLFRSNGEGAFTPEPDRYFFNSPELNADANAISSKNADVAPGRSDIPQRLTYVSMYIVAAGVNPQNFSLIYSKPTHISIFKLPNAN